MKKGEVRKAMNDRTESESSEGLNRFRQKPSDWSMPLQNKRKSLVQLSEDILTSRPGQRGDIGKYHFH